MERRHRGYQHIMHHTGQNTEVPAILISNGAQAVGIAQTNHDGLGIDGTGEIATGELCQQTKTKAGYHIAGHNGPDVTGVRAGIAASQHTENDAEGDAVEGGTDGIVIGQNEQAVHAHIHQEGGIAVGGGEIGHQIRILQQIPVILGLAAHEEGHHDANAKHRTAEDIHRQLGSNLQRVSGRGSRQGHAQGLIQNGLQEEGHHTDRQRSGIQIKALVNLGRIGKTGRQEKADGHTHSHSQQRAVPGEGDDILTGIAEHQIGDQGRNTGGEQHGIDIGADLLLLHQAVNYHTQEGRPNIHDIDAPGAEAQSQNEGQVRAVIGHRTGQAIQAQANSTHQRHIQEGGSIATHSEIVGGNLAGVRQDLPQAAEHPAAVGHTKCRNQKASRQKTKQQLQEIRFRKIVEFFHVLSFFMAGAPSCNRQRTCSITE